MSKPSNWYDMDYEQQREWEAAERACQREKDELQCQAEQAQEDTDAARRRATRAIEAAHEDYSNLSASYDSLSDENEELKARVAKLEATLAVLRGDEVSP